LNGATYFEKYICVFILRRAHFLIEKPFGNSTLFISGNCNRFCSSKIVSRGELPIKILICYFIEIKQHWFCPLEAIILEFYDIQLVVKTEGLRLLLNSAPQAFSYSRKEHKSTKRRYSFDRSI